MAVLGPMLIVGCTDDTGDPDSSSTAGGTSTSASAASAGAQPSLVVTGDISVTSSEIAFHGGKPVDSGPACLVTQSRMVLDVGFRVGPTTYFLWAEAPLESEQDAFEFAAPGVSATLSTVHARSTFTDPDLPGSGRIVVRDGTVTVDGELRSGSRSVRVVATVPCAEVG